MSLLPAVVLQSSNQKEKVKRLVKYCRELDGTEIQVVEIPPEINAVPHPIGVELAIRWAGQRFNHPWLYIEADSIPLKPGWREAISAEYFESGKLFMLPSLEGLNRNDVASAIGVWPAHLHTYLPEKIVRWPLFDYHVYQHHADKIHFTKSIQHSYGVYGIHRVVRRHEFPRDKDVLRPEALIFHADPTQSIIRKGATRQSIYHSGDLGDIIAALPVIRKQGGGILYIGPHHDGVSGKRPRELMTQIRFGGIEPLLRLQPYIHHLEYLGDYHKADLDLSRFRLTDQLPQENLALWQARSIGRADPNFDLEPWLEVGQVEPHDRIIVSRSLRYHNSEFPWLHIAKRYGMKLLFVGSDEEHRRFKILVGKPIEKAKTRNALDLAEVIAGAELQFSNQSLPFWLGAALGKTVVQETCQTELNSIVERDNLYYSRSKEEIEQWRPKFL